MGGMGRTGDNTHPGKSVEDMPEVGANLRKLRADRGLSLEKFAQLVGVSRAMLGQIELGQSTPTITTLWKIARALDVPFSALIGGSAGAGPIHLTSKQTKRLTNHDGSFVSRALFPLGGPRKVEFYELELSPQCEERAVPHPPGTVENLVVNQGAIEIEVAGQSFKLDCGDVLTFPADVAHTYRNRGRKKAVAYLVMTYVG